MVLSVMVVVVIVVLVMAMLFYRARHPFITRVFPTDTIQRVVDSILQQSEYISTVQSPHIAMIQSRECQAALYTVISLVGGQSAIDTICGIDTERLQNILYFQEKQIYVYLQNMST